MLLALPVYLRKGPIKDHIDNISQKNITSASVFQKRYPLNVTSACVSKKLKVPIKVQVCLGKELNWLVYQIVSNKLLVNYVTSMFMINGLND